MWRKQSSHLIVLKTVDKGVSSTEETKKCRDMLYALCNIGLLHDTCTCVIVCLKITRRKLWGFSDLYNSVILIENANTFFTFCPALLVTNFSTALQIICQTPVTFIIEIIAKSLTLGLKFAKQLVLHLDVFFIIGKLNPRQITSNFLNFLSSGPKQENVLFTQLQQKNWPWKHISPFFMRPRPTFSLSRRLKSPCTAPNTTSHCKKNTF